MNKIRALAYGWYGAGNLGDELILVQLKAWCHELGAILSVLSIDPECTRNAHGIDAINAYNLPAVAEAMQHSDLFILGGGGLFQTYHPLTIPSLYSAQRFDISAYARPVLMAAQMDLPILLWAQGIGPLVGREAREIVRAIFNSATEISVRDDCSKQLLAEIGLERDILVAPDPVWAYPIPEATENPSCRTEARKRLGLILRPWPFVEDWERRFIGALQTAIEPHAYTLVWIPLQLNEVPRVSESDISYIRALMAKVGDKYQHEYVEYPNIADAVRSLSDCDGLACMRLHAQILSLRLRKPTLSIEYDPKMAVVSKQAGVPTEMRLSPDASQQAWTHAFTALAARSQVGEICPANLESVSAQAMLHRGVLEKALETASAKRGQRCWRPNRFDWIGAWADDLAHRLWSERGAKTAELERTLAELEQHIVRLNSKVSESDARLANLEAAAVKRDQIIVDLNTDLADRDTRLADLEADAVKCDDIISKLNLVLSECDGVGDVAKQTVTDPDDLMTALRELLTDNCGAIASCKKALLDNQQAYVTVVASRSWRYTRPFRFAMRLARAITRRDERFILIKSLYWNLPESLRLRLINLRYAYVRHYRQLGTSPFETNDGTTAGSLLSTVPGWVSTANQRERVAIIPCAFEFDELFNQRPINAAKHYAAKGYLVIFVAWQWSPEDQLTTGCGEVRPNIHQIPLYDFLRYCDHLTLRLEYSFYMVTLPAPLLVDPVYALRSRGYAIIYDIMDDWEAFSNVGQAPWFVKSIEESLVLHSDFVSVVSPALKNKFSALRSDILVIGNGYTPEVLGVNYKGAALGNPNKTSVIGYFGHLTDAWFDWSLVFHIAKSRPDLTIEIVGYGEPAWVAQDVGKIANIRLLGKIPPGKLHSYASRWRAGIIPFVQSTLSDAVDPIKIYEYLFFGLPTIVTGLSHLKDYPMTFIATHHDILEIIDTAMETKVAEDLQMFLEQTTWHARFETQFGEATSRETLRLLYEN